MKKKKIAFVFLSVMMAVTLFGYNAFASENESQGKGFGKGQGFHMGQAGPCIKDMTLAEWKEKEISRINSITDDFFAKMKTRMNIQLSITEWKAQEIKKINEKTEEDFSRMKGMMGHKGGMRGGPGLMKMPDISTLDYSTWKQEMIKNINAITEDDFNKAKESFKGFAKQGRLSK